MIFYSLLSISLLFSLPDKRKSAQKIEKMFNLAEGLEQFSEASLLRKVVEKREELWLIRFVTSDI